MPLGAFTTFDIEMLETKIPIRFELEEYKFRRFLKLKHIYINAPLIRILI